MSLVMLIINNELPAPAPVTELQRVEVIKILGVNVSHGLSVSAVSAHVQTLITSCTQAVYARRVLRCSPSTPTRLHEQYALVNSKVLVTRIVQQSRELSDNSHNFQFQDDLTFRRSAVEHCSHSVHPQ